tara:strand:+ start:113 stop:739 length:627 start_codon:yes stop_codon:yes gene_type:complete
MIIIQDNFLKDPYAMRSIALKQKYSSPADTHYPGYRTDIDYDCSAIVKDIAIKHVLPTVRHLTKNPNLNSDLSAFQYVTEDYDQGSFHIDVPNTYTCIIFLSPDPPDYSGTEVCDEHPDPSHGYFSQKYWDDMIEAKRSFYKDTSNRLNRYRYNNLRKKFMNKNKPIVKVPNKFNRMLLFDSPLFHRAQKFFGTSIGNSRLTFVTFFK